VAVRVGVDGVGAGDEGDGRKVGRPLVAGPAPDPQPAIISAATTNRAAATTSRCRARLVASIAPPSAGRSGPLIVRGWTVPGIGRSTDAEPAEPMADRFTVNTARRRYIGA
jgi:hypothetical protein